MSRAADPSHAQYLLPTLAGCLALAVLVAGLWRMGLAIAESRDALAVAEIEAEDVLACGRLGRGPTTLGFGDCRVELANVRRAERLRLTQEASFP